jgi:two-component system sensor histidine kinase RpfC
MLRPEATRKGLSLALVLDNDVPARAHGDVRYLRQILLNLLANAVKFTEVGGVTVWVVAVRHLETVQLRVFVSDTGPGIKECDREHIFQAFSQSDDTAHRRHEGTGLGLAIARQLAEGMGGSLTVQASTQKGSTFALTLPLGVAVDAQDVDIGEYRVRLVVPGGGTAEDLDAALRAAGARTGSSGSVVALVYDLRQLEAAERLDDRWLDKLAAHAPPATPCILIGTGDGQVVSRLASRFHIAINMAPPVSEQDMRQALGLIVAGASWGNSELEHSLEGAHAHVKRTGRVLVVEDNPVNSMVTTKILETGGHSVVVAESGEAALDLLETESIDAVLMDVNMPGESGIETVKLFRFTEFGGHRSIPIIALTADATPETRLACLDAGMDDYVTKPVDARRLLDTLHSHLCASSRSQQESAPEVFTESTVNVLDTGAIETLVELDPSGAFLIEVADEFVRDTRMLVADIRTALVAGHMERAGDLLHGLKSAAGYAGAAQVRARASQLHGQIQAGDAGDLPDFVADLVRDADRYRVEIDRATKSSHTSDAVS